MNKRYRLNFLPVEDFDPIEPPQGILRRAWSALQLPRRGRSEIERTAAQFRAARLFEPTFKPPWNR